MQKYNLPQVLKGHIEADENGNTVTYELSGVSIPMLQRDYAQGRIENAYTLERFLDSVFKALTEDKPMQLDFVYGSIEKIGDDHFFIPLDGQQRLTLLFLLYWSIGNWELDESDIQHLQDLLKNFSYATRPTAKDFCKKLAALRITTGTHPSAIIREQSWFYELFEQDPTISSILEVVDAIYHRYCKLSVTVYPKLDNIGFYILPLGSFGLTDELYIKMNARGKQLTGFENFKVDLINWMQDKDNPLKEVYKEKKELSGREMPYHTALSIKLDNDWTSLFWSYAKEDSNGELIVDDDYLRFWNRYLLHHFVADDRKPVDRAELHPVFRDRYHENKFRYTGFDHYRDLFSDNVQILHNVESVLDQLCLHHTTINQCLAPSWNLSSKWCLFDKEISQTDRIIHFATTRFLEANVYGEVNFKRWMRVVWNIAVDPDIRSIGAMIRVIRLIDKLASHAHNIYGYLASGDSLLLVGDGSSAIEAQLGEERIKAKLIISDGQWEKIIIEAESHPLFTGSIGFLISDKPSPERFKHRTGMAFTVFSGTGLKAPYAKDHRLMRATIAHITDMRTLAGLNFKDHAINWQLLLRRNKVVQAFMRMLCSEVDDAHQQAMIDTAISSPSGMPFSDQQHIHQQLYQPTDFHEWLQTRDPVKALELKWYDDHAYVHRPSSWYDRVMLDTYRNEIITAMIDRLGFSTYSRCGSANFYWDYSILLTKNLTESASITAYFDRHDTLKITLENTDSGEEPLTSTYDYAEIESDGEVAALINKIEIDVFKLTDSVRLPS